MSVANSLIYAGETQRTFQDGIETNSIVALNNALVIGSASSTVSLPNAQLGQTSTTHDHPEADDSLRLASTFFCKRAINVKEALFLSQANTFTGENRFETQLVNDSSTLASSTKFVKDNIDLLKVSANTFTQEQTFSSINTDTINSANPVVFTQGTIQASNILPTVANGIIQLGPTTLATSGSLSLITTGLVSFFPRTNVGDANKTSLSFRSATFAGEIGSVRRTSSTSVAYQTSSDRRLKENIVDMGPMTPTILKMKPREYVWKSTKKKDFGFIAQELFEALPHTKPEGYVEEPKDEEGKPDYYGVDYGSITPYLLKALQETITRVAQLEREVLLLKNRV